MPQNSEELDTELLDYAVTCSMRKRWGYPGYETADKTSIALRRRIKGTSKAERSKALDLADELNRCAEVLAKRFVREHRKIHATDLMNASSWRKIVMQLAEEHPQFANKSIETALSWALYWGVLR